MTVENLEINRWDEIETWMQDKIDKLDKALEDALDKDGNILRDIMPGLILGISVTGPAGMIAVGAGVAGDIVCRIAGKLIPGDKTIFPPITDPDGNQIKTDSPIEFAGHVANSANRYADIARQRLQDIRGIWENKYKPHAMAPKKLHDVSESWGEVAKAMQELPQGIQEVQQIDGWGGDGATAYAKVVPNQAKATQDTHKFASASGNVLGNASTGLQSLYLSFAAQLAQAETQMSGFEPQGDDWGKVVNTGPHARQAIAVLDNTLKFLKEELPSAEMNWAQNIDTASDILQDNETIDEKTFKDGKWPVSVSDLGDLEKTGTKSVDPAAQQPAFDPETTAPSEQAAPSTPAQGTDTSSDTQFDQNDVDSIW